MPTGCELGGALFLVVVILGSYLLTFGLNKAAGKPRPKPPTQPRNLDDDQINRGWPL